MADHVRRQLREAIATAVTGLTTTGANVFQSRIYPLQDAELPGLIIYTTGEEVVDQSVGNLIGRNVAVVIEGKTKAAADLDDVLDLISKEVEIALAALLTVGGQSIPLQYDGCEIDMEENERPAGIISMRFSTVLYTQRTTPDVIG